MAVGCELMISREELDDIKEKRKTTRFYEEKEYFQYIFLRAIAEYPDNVIFKGGTCLRICFGSERASEDLDFSTTFAPDKLRIMIPLLLKDFARLNIPWEIPVQKEREGNIRFEIRFQGPLFQGTRESTNTLKVDFSKRKAQHTLVKVVPKLFSDVPPFTIVILEEREILAEKIRALTMRTEPRDLYDIWLLLGKGVPYDEALVRLKLKEDHLQKADLRFPSEQEYYRDLKPLLRVVPTYDQALEEVKRSLGK